MPNRGRSHQAAVNAVLGVHGQGGAKRQQITMVEQGRHGWAGLGWAVLSQKKKKNEVEKSH